MWSSRRVSDPGITNANQRRPLISARLFSGSFESAIYLLSSICTIPSCIAVLPAINTNFTHHICAGLANGDTIPGQNSISHPSEPTALPTSPKPSNRSTTHPNGDFPQPYPTNIETETADSVEDANLPGSLPTLRKQYITFSKTPTDSDNLPARIARIWYINPYGQEIRPLANPKIIDALTTARCIVYSIGSLYTSIVPSLILRGVGNALAHSGAGVPKVLILNGTLDRETGPASEPFTAMDFVQAIAKAGMESRGVIGREVVPSAELRSYVTHLIYLDGAGAPTVDREKLWEVGIECTRVYGRRSEDGIGWRYDENGLAQALEALVDRSRRNTLER